MKHASLVILTGLTYAGISRLDLHLILACLLMLTAIRTHVLVRFDLRKYFRWHLRKVKLSYVSPFKNRINPINRDDPARDTCV